MDSLQGCRICSQPQGWRVQGYLPFTCPLCMAKRCVLHSGGDISASQGVFKVLNTALLIASSGVLFCFARTSLAHRPRERGILLQAKTMKELLLEVIETKMLAALKDLYFCSDVSLPVWFGRLPSMGLFARCSEELSCFLFQCSQLLPVGSHPPLQELFRGDLWLLASQNQWELLGRRWLPALPC